MPECSSATESFGVRVAGVAVFETLCSSRFLHGLRIKTRFTGWVHVSGIAGTFNQIRVSPALSGQALDCTGLTTEPGSLKVL